MGVNRDIDRAKLHQEENLLLSRKMNPLPIDWARKRELNNQKLMDRVIEDLKTHRDTTVVIVQKVSAKDLASGFKPLPNKDRYALVQHVRSCFVKLDETKFFEIYQ